MSKNEVQAVHPQTDLQEFGGVFFSMFFFFSLFFIISLLFFFLIATKKYELQKF